MAPTSPKFSKLWTLFKILAALIALGVLLTVSGFAYAASQESHDPFCASCHTEPETTFVQRATTEPVDLASSHTAHDTRCIDCHSGAGFAGRIQAELLGARNASKWYLGMAVQPAPLLYPIPDENCLKCHQDVTQKGYAPKQTIPLPGGRFGGHREEGGSNHWHELMTKWQAKDANAGKCTTCHTGHSTGSNAQAGFMESQTTKNACDACHKAIRGEDD